MATIQEQWTPKAPYDGSSVQSRTACIENLGSEHGLRTKDATPLNNIGMLPEDAMLLMYRSIKTACHEICHVLGMTHCPYYECLMNGSNLVTEADKKPFALCPICLRKLTSYFQIQNQLSDRYFKLINEIDKVQNKRFKKEL